MDVSRDLIVQVLNNSFITNMIDTLPDSVFEPAVNPATGEIINIVEIIEDAVSKMSESIADGVMEGVIPGSISAANAAGSTTVSTTNIGEGGIDTSKVAGGAAASSMAYFIDIATWLTMLPTAGSAAGVASGIFAESTSETVGGYVYKAYGDEWQLAKADTVDTTTGSLAVAVGIDTSDDGLVANGFVRIPSGAIDCTADSQLRGGVPVFLSTSTAGGIQANVPQSIGNVVRPVGVCLAFDILSGDMLVHFTPDNTYLEISG
jgi:hypothetical protein